MGRFAARVALHRPAILGHALRLTRDRDDAEDLVQKAILRAFRAFGRFEGNNFRAWLLTIVTNLHINDLRRASRTPTSAIEEEDEHASPGPSPHAAFTEHDIDPEIMEAIHELPPQLARTFMLAEIAGLSHAEVSVAENIPMGTVQSRTYRARAFLRERLADYAREVHGVE